ncbi:hypothetical protein EZJ58_1759 [Sodalis ligni]|uniref:Addiction module HigA family antidote n=1 Tax=Sodalis ligni TaxID=2697027 RepID=A0A4R1N903_9GAMM|nr:hypothetical protein EZJ58_1759 [Sodalis ligni]
MTMFNPPHPGEIIAETLDDLNIGIRELSRALHVAPSTVQRLVGGQNKLMIMRGSENILGCFLRNGEKLA